MIEVFKMIHGIDKVNLEKLFYIEEEGRTRKHSLCLKIKRHVNSNIEFNFFHLLEPPPRSVVSCKSLSTFKMKLDEFMAARGEI